MDEIVVARSSTGPAKVLAALCVGIVLVRGWGIWWPVRIPLYLGVLYVAHMLLGRLERMKLSVTPEVVHVVNFNSKFALDLQTVRIDDAKNPDAWPQNDMVGAGEFAANAPDNKQARMLCLTDDSGIKAQVGVAPSYGARLDEIAEELYIAVDRMREVTSGGGTGSASGSDESDVDGPDLDVSD